MYALSSSIQNRVALPTRTSRRLTVAPRAAGRTEEQDRGSRGAGQEIKNNLASQIRGVTEQNPSKIPVPELDRPSPDGNRNQAFNGFGTISELANSRLAMVGFVAAIASEFATGRGVYEQISFHPAAPLAILLTFIALISATFIPAAKGKKLEGNGAFTPWAEVTNGRAAMIGFVALLITESIKGGPLIG